MHIVGLIFFCLLAWMALAGGGRRYVAAAVAVSLFLFPTFWLVVLMLIATAFNGGH